MIARRVDGPRGGGGRAHRLLAKVGSPSNTSTACPLVISALTLFGVGSGVLIWFVLHAVIASEIYGIASNDPLIVGLVEAAVVLIVLGAAAPPAWRGAHGTDGCLAV